MIAAALLGLGVALLVVDHAHALAGYASAYFATLAVALGALVWLGIALVTRARWLAPLRGPLEGLTRLFVPLAALLVPLLVRAPALYPWGQRRGHLTAPLADGVGPAALHAALAFAAWLGVAALLRGRGPTRPATEARRAAAALPLVGLTLTVFALDFTMTLDPGHRSTIHALLWFASGAVVALAIAAIGAVAALASADAEDSARRETGADGPAPADRVARFFAVGKMLLAMVLFRAYLHVSQLVLVWEADLPPEVTWYARRSAGPWASVTVAVVLASFVLPFLLLLSWRLKRSPRRVAGVAALLVLAHALESTWLVLPPLAPGGPTVAALGALLAFAGGGLLAARARTAPGGAPDPAALAAARTFEDA